ACGNELGVHVIDRAREIHERIENVDASAGHARSRGFAFECTPARKMLTRVLVAVMAFDVHQTSQNASCDDLSQRSHRRPEALVLPDAEQHTCFTARGDSACRIGPRKGERLLT